MFRASRATDPTRTLRRLRWHRGRRVSLRLLASSCSALFLVAAAALGALPRQVFVTSVYGPATLSSWPVATPGATGTDAADSICRNLAVAAGLDRSSSFRAWLSDSLDDAWCRVQDLTGTRDG